jgi:hypothetical protein
VGDCVQGEDGGQRPVDVPFKRLERLADVRAFLEPDLRVGWGNAQKHRFPHGTQKRNHWQRHLFVGLLECWLPNLRGNPGWRSEDHQETIPEKIIEETPIRCQYVLEQRVQNTMTESARGQLMALP